MAELLVTSSLQQILCVVVLEAKATKHPTVPLSQLLWEYDSNAVLENGHLTELSLSLENP